MNEIEYKVLRTIANSTPVPQGDVVAVFKLLNESIDATIRCIVFATGQGLDPRSVARDNMNARARASQENRERAEKRGVFKRLLLTIGVFLTEIGD